MNGHGGSAAVGMAENDVAPALPHDGEAVALQKGDDLGPGETREPRAHTATRTFVAPTSW
jgi:hypothetical protein